MSLRIALAAAALCLGLGTPLPASATPSARLVYSRGAGAETCPDEVALRRAVALRIGYDPFFPWAEKTIVASVLRLDRGFSVKVHLVDSGGGEHGAREIRTDGRCDDLLDAAALAIAIAIDPLLLAPPAPPESPAPVVAPVPDAASPAARIGTPPPLQLPSPEPGPAMTFSVSAGAIASLGVAPALAAGLSIGASTRWRLVSLGLEARVDAPASRTFYTPGGPASVSSWLATAAVVPCVHSSALMLCALGQLGSTRVSALDVVGPTAGSARWTATGGRAGVTVPVGRNAALRLGADVLVNLDRARVSIGATQVWHAPLICASYGLDVTVPFL